LERQAAKDEPKLGGTLGTTNDRNDDTAGLEEISSITTGTTRTPMITNTPLFRGRKSHKDSSTDSEDLEEREAAARDQEQIAKSDRYDLRNRAYVDQPQYTETSKVAGKRRNGNLGDNEGGDGDDNDNGKDLADILALLDGSGSSDGNDVGDNDGNSNGSNGSDGGGYSGDDEIDFGEDDSRGWETYPGIPSGD